MRSATLSVGVFCAQAGAFSTHGKLAISTSNEASSPSSRLRPPRSRGAILFLERWLVHRYDAMTPVDLGELEPDADRFPQGLVPLIHNVHSL